MNYILFLCDFSIAFDVFVFDNLHLIGEVKLFFF